MHSWWQQMREGGLDKGGTRKEHPFPFTWDMPHACRYQNGRSTVMLAWRSLPVVVGVLHRKGGCGEAGRGHGIGSPGDIAITSVCWGDGSDAGAPWSVCMAICFTSKRGSSSLPPIRCFWWVVDPLQGGGEQRSTSLLGAHHSAADGCMSLQFFCCCFSFLMRCANCWDVIGTPCIKF